MQKLLILIFITVIFTIIQLNFPTLHLIKISCGNYNFSFGLYIFVALLCAKWTIQRSIYKIRQCFVDRRAINKLAKNILYPQNLSKISVPAKFQQLHTAILIKNGFTLSYTPEGILPECQFYLIQQRLYLAITENNYTQAIKITKEICNTFPQFINRISKEIILIEKYCIRNNLDFNINLGRRNRRLSDNYKLEMEKIKLENISNEHDKIKKVKELLKKAPDDKDLQLEYIKLCPEIEKKLKLISIFFNRSPNRYLAYELVKIKKDKDTFFWAQRITQNIPDTNIEKLWFLVIVATELKFNKYISGLIIKLLKLNERQTIYEFFVRYYGTFSKMPDLIEIVQDDVNNH